MSTVLDGLYYSESHEWLKVDGEFGYIGITDYAQHQLGNVVYVDLPEVDDELNQGEEFGAVESVKAASDLLSPISGIVVEINDKLRRSAVRGRWQALIIERRCFRELDLQS